MKNLELSNFNVRSLNSNELIETTGGIVPLILLGAALLLTGCVNSCNTTTNNYNSNNGSGNGNGTGNGNSVGNNNGNDGCKQ